MVVSHLSKTWWIMMNTADISPSWKNARFCWESASLSDTIFQHSHGSHGPYIDDLPSKTSIYKGFSMTILNIQMVLECLQITRLIRFLQISYSNQLFLICPRLVTISRYPHDCFLTSKSIPIQSVVRLISIDGVPKAHQNSIGIHIEEKVTHLIDNWPA